MPLTRLASLLLFSLDQILQVFALFTRFQKIA